jgi:hypothetical protein
MIEIEKPNITLNEKNDDNTYGKIVVEPLERGYGTTIGNSLRRILLSSLPGAAVTSINIQGVLHEFSTIPGVREDVTEIILNIKNLAAKMNVPGPVQLLIDAKGPKEVTAADIITGGDVEIVNEDLHIATLEEGAELIIEMEMEQGRGYVTAERNKKDSQAIGVIPIDSIYTPANGTLRVCDSQGNYIKSGQSVEVGTILIISAIPDDHYVLDSLKAGGSSISGNTYSVDASKTNLIEAHFKLAEVKVTLSDTDNGTIKAYTYDGTEIPSGSYIAVGEKIRVVATPKNENFQLDTLKMNGNNIKNGSQNTVPAEDVTLSATFKYVGDMPSIGDDTGGGGGGGGSTAIQETETATFESISVLTTDGSLTALGTITESDDETVVTVSGESFAKLADHAETNSTGIVFNAGLGSVTFNSKALSYIDGIADSGDVVLTVSKVSPDVLSEENRRLVGNHPVYDFSLTAGDVKVNTFGGGEVNISIPYTLKPGETAETLVVYYIDDAGILKTIRGAYHADTGTVDFTVTHFSYYTMGNNPVDFRDVPAESWYYKPVSFVAARGITLGLKEGIFGQSFVEAGIVSGSDGFLYPASMSTRAQMAQVLYKLLSK